MSDAEKCLANSLGLKSRDDYESVRQYDQTRFRSARMRRLDARERHFARFAYELAGPEAAILDVPCGNGRFYEIFSRSGQLTMADYSENMLKACREKYRLDERVRLIRSDIAALPLPDASVDLAFCMRLFHHMTTDVIRAAALRELARVSRKYVALSFYNCCSLRYCRKRLFHRRIGHGYVSAGHLTALAREVGLLPIHRFPRVNLVEQQCMMILEKK
ncbi:MAG: class I SAM-dependent methyltransferase [Sedimentisphaerales bacterium]|nr:class I SAM-dependent methyltransferase [Sedimentisphaerales bacterium]